MIDTYSIKIDVVESDGRSAIEACRIIGLIPDEVIKPDGIGGLHVNLYADQRTIVRCSETDHIVVETSGRGHFQRAMRDLATLYGRPVRVENEDGPSPVKDAVYQPHQ
jgi:hypothetical protein